MSGQPMPGQPHFCGKATFTVNSSTASSADAEVDFMAAVYTTGSLTSLYLDFSLQPPNSRVNLVVNPPTHFQIQDDVNTMPKSECGDSTNSVPCVIFNVTVPISVKGSLADIGSGSVTLTNASNGMALSETCGGSSAISLSNGNIVVSNPIWSCQ
jgi:hypothetical protein